MKQLTKQEIKYVKETGFTPTVYQCAQYYLTKLTDEQLDLNSPTYKEDREKYETKWFAEAEKLAKEKYSVDLQAFLDKNIGSSLNDYDGISLEYVATYLFYCFFTKEELEKLTDEEATRFLKDYRYYSGFRKWDGGNLQYVQEAIEVYEGNRFFYLQDDGNVWNTERSNIKDNPYFLERTILVKPILD